MCDFQGRLSHEDVEKHHNDGVPTTRTMDGSPHRFLSIPYLAQSKYPIPPALTTIPKISILLSSYNYSNSAQIRDSAHDKSGNDIANIHKYTCRGQVRNGEPWLNSQRYSAHPLKRQSNIQDNNRRDGQNTSSRVRHKEILYYTFHNVADRVAKGFHIWLPNKINSTESSEDPIDHHTD